MNRGPIPETPTGYLARAKAVFKVNRRNHGPFEDRPPSNLGEFLHQADLEGA